MNHHLPKFAAALLLALLPVHAGWGQEVRPAEKGTFLGLLFGPRSSTESTTYLRAEMVPVVPRSSPPPAKLAPGNTGVVVTHVLPGSPAARAGLRRNDVVLAYDKVKVRDCEQLARLI